MRENKLEIILNEAAHLIGQKGYPGTSFQKIADKVGIHKSTLFHYFRNKEELLLLILEKSITEVRINLEHITNDGALRPEEKLEKAIENHLTMLVAYLDNVNVYLNDFKSLSNNNQVIYLKKRKKYENSFKQIITEMQIAGYFSGLNPKVVTYGILGMLNWTAKWFRMEGPLKIEEVSQVFYRMVTQKDLDHWAPDQHQPKKVDKK